MKKPDWVPPAAYDALTTYEAHRRIITGKLPITDGAHEHSVKVPILQALVLDPNMKQVWEYVVFNAGASRNGKRVLVTHQEPDDVYRDFIHYTADAYLQFISIPKTSNSDMTETIRDVAATAKKLTRMLNTLTACYFLNPHIGAANVFWKFGDRELWYRLLNSRITTVAVLEDLIQDCTVAARLKSLSRPHAKNAHRAFVARALSRYFSMTFGAPSHKIVSIVLNVAFPTATPPATPALVRELTNAM